MGKSDLSPIHKLSCYPQQYQFQCLSYVLLVLKVISRRLNICDRGSFVFCPKPKRRLKNQNIATYLRAKKYKIKYKNLESVSIPLLSTASEVVVNWNLLGHLNSTIKNNILKNCKKARRGLNLVNGHYSSHFSMEPVKFVDNRKSCSLFLLRPIIMFELFSSDFKMTLRGLHFSVFIIHTSSAGTWRGWICCSPLCLLSFCIPVDNDKSEKEEKAGKKTGML